MALAVLLGAGASIGFALKKQHLYSSETVILYREVIKSEVLYGEDALVDREDVGTRLKEVVLSRKRLKDIISEMGLYPDVVNERGEEAAVEKLRQHIDFQAKGGDIFHISFTGESPEQAHQVTEYLAESLIAEEKRTRTEQVSATKQFLDDELAKAEAELALKEKGVAEFLAKYPEFGLETFASVGASVRAEQRKNKPESAIRSPRRSRSSDRVLRNLENEASRLRRAMRDPGGRGNSEARAELEEAEQRLAEAKAELSDKKSRFTDQHPDVKAASSRVSSAKRRVSRAQRAVADAKRPRSAAKDKLRERLERVEQKIRDRKSKLRREAKGSPAPNPKVAEPEPDSDSEIVDLETDWTRLNREVLESRERYDLIETKHFRASIDANSQLASQSGQMSVIDEAYVPTRPAGAPKRLIVMAGTTAAGMIGFAIALLLALVDDRFYGRRDIERLDMLPVLVVIPSTTKRPWLRRLLFRD